MTANRMRSGPARPWEWRAGLVAASVLVVIGAGCANTVVTRAAIVPPLASLTPLGPEPSPPGSGGLCLSCIGPGPVSEISPGPFNTLRTKALANIATKLNALNAASATLDTLSHLGAGGLSIERAEIANTADGLSWLKTELTGETDIVRMRSEAESLVDYVDVGTVIVPKVVLLQSADTILRGTDNLAGQIASLQIRINTAAQGRSVVAAQAALNTVQGETGQAAAVANGIMDSVPVIGPADVNQITAVNATVAQARNDLSAAQSGIGAVGAALQSVGG